MLAAGSQAPAFSLRCGPYRETTLDDYRGKRLVVVFYVADWHPVCTDQLLRYRAFDRLDRRHPASWGGDFHKILPGTGRGTAQRS